MSGSEEKGGSFYQESAAHIRSRVASRRDYRRELRIGERVTLSDGVVGYYDGAERVRVPVADMEQGNFKPGREGDG